jgi:hypothetical protein
MQHSLAEGLLQHVLPQVRGPQLDIHAVHLAQRRLARRTRTLLDYLVQNLSAAQDRVSV